jgi:hypothetical protein
MESEITVRRAATSMQGHKPSNSFDKHSEIVKLLVKFSIRRQAAINTETLLVYADDLKHLDLPAIEEGLRVLSLTPRAEGETAFPDIGTVLQAVRRIINPRYQRIALDEINARALHREANPEMYITDDETKAMVDRLAAKHGMRATKKPEVRDYKEELCPHCHKHLPVATNIRFWSSQELRDLADVVEKNEKIAAANRESNRAAVEA